MTALRRKVWPTAEASVKDREMMRVTRTPLAHGGGSIFRGWLRCAVVLGVLGCESRAPAVQSEPGNAPSARVEPGRAEAPASDVAPASPSPGAVSAPQAAPEQQVDLARLEPAKHEIRAEGAAPTPSTAPAAGSAPAARATGSTAAPSPTSQAEPTLGAIVNDDAFSTWLQAPSPAPVGAATYVEAILVAKAPYHCNAEYPHKFKLGAPSAGVTYPEGTVRGMQVTPERSVLRIPFQAANAGLVKVAGTLSFSVCTEERCLVEKRDLSLDLEVK